MLNWLSQHENIVTMALWVINALILLALAGPWLEKLHYEKQHRVHLRMAARAMARLAVFDSWVRAGGRNSHLAVQVEKSLRDDYARSMQKHGDEYLQAFVQYETEADGEINALMKTLGLVPEETYGDTIECSLCEGRGYEILDHMGMQTSECPGCLGKGFIDIRGEGDHEEKS